MEHLFHVRDFEAQPSTVLASEKGLLPNLALKSAVPTPNNHEKSRKYRANAQHEYRSTGTQMKARASRLANLQRAEADQISPEKWDKVAQLPNLR